MGISLRINDKAVSVMHLPERKKPCLMVFTEPNIWTKVASFNNEKDSDEFMEYLEEMFQDVYFERRTETIDFVRCEECKYGTKLATTNKITCKLDRQVWEKTDFCSYGERRTDE